MNDFREPQDMEEQEREDKFFVEKMNEIMLRAIKVRRHYIQKSKQESEEAVLRKRNEK